MYNINYKRVRRRLPRLQFTSLNIHYQMFHVKCFCFIIKTKKTKLNWNNVYEKYNLETTHGKTKLNFDENSFFFFTKFSFVFLFASSFYHSLRWKLHTFLQFGIKQGASASETVELRTTYRDKESKDYEMKNFKVINKTNWEFSFDVLYFIIFLRFSYAITMIYSKWQREIRRINTRPEMPKPN